MHKNQAGLTVAGKCGQPKTEGVQVGEGVGLVFPKVDSISTLGNPIN